MTQNGLHESGTVRRPGAGGAPWAVAFVTIYLLFQFSLPVVKLFEERPARFGWQMYSGYRTFPTVELVYRDSVAPIDAESLVVRNRLDMDFAPHLTRHFCRRTPAEAVIVRGSGLANEWVVRCLDQ